MAKRNMYDDLLKKCMELFPTYVEDINVIARSLYNEYCEKEKGKPKEITMHTVESIFPCIAFYKAVGECTGDRKMAYSLIEKYFEDVTGVTAKRLQLLCKIPFAYRLVPWIMAKVIHKVYGVKSGFAMTDHQVKGKRCHIDMLQCPYYSYCRMYGCPELAVAFCNSDDIAFGNMHPKLSWKRKKTLARENEICDFILEIEE